MRRAIMLGLLSLCLCAPSLGATRAEGEALPPETEEQLADEAEQARRKNRVLLREEWVRADALPIERLLEIPFGIGEAALRDIARRELGCELAEEGLPDSAENLLLAECFGLPMQLTLTFRDDQLAVFNLAYRVIGPERGVQQYLADIFDLYLRILCEAEARYGKPIDGKLNGHVEEEYRSFHYPLLDGARDAQRLREIFYAPRENNLMQYESFDCGQDRFLEVLLDQVSFEEPSGQRHVACTFFVLWRDGSRIELNNDAPFLGRDGEYPL